jgi:hypothetical protein
MCFCPSVLNGIQSNLKIVTLHVTRCVTRQVTPSNALLFLLICSPSPSPNPGPKLALISEFPPEYSPLNPTANLTATSTNNSVCDESPSARLGVNNVTVTMPGTGFCNPSDDGQMPPGTYSLSQNPPADTKFERWDCFNVTAGMTPVAVNISSGVALQGSDSITCVAKYALVDPTCGDVLLGTPGAQPYNCSRATLARNESAAALSPPSDSLCCQVRARWICVRVNDGISRHVTAVVQ